MVKEFESIILFDNFDKDGKENDYGGFSILITCIDENNKCTKILFDTGFDGEMLINNIDMLKEDVDDIDLVILSHGHFDHTGGLTEILKKINRKVPVLCHPDAINDKILYKNTENELNVGFSANNKMNNIKDRMKLIKAKDEYSIGNGIWTTGEVLRKNKYETLNDQLRNITKTVDGLSMKDEILDDISLIIKLSDGNKIIVTGCCHTGIVNLVNNLEINEDNQIISIIGGLQLHMASEEQLKFTIDKLKELPLLSIYPQHSSGKKGINYIMENMSGVYKKGGVGTVVKFKSNR